MSGAATSIVYRAYPEFDRAEDLLKFRLTYEGILHASGNGRSNGAHKQQIRRCFHPQLKRLFETSPLFKHVLIDSAPENKYFATGPKPFGLDNLADQGKMGNFRFVPLVTEGFDLWCGLEILFLRPGASGKIFKSGDIDNRIKTLFDALKRPKNLQDIEKASPVDGEDPFFCLLDDDSLVAKMAIETDNLLGIIGGGVPSEHDARIIITVTLRPAIATWSNMGFAAE